MSLVQDPKTRQFFNVISEKRMTSSDLFKAISKKSAALNGHSMSSNLPLVVMTISSMSGLYIITLSQLVSSQAI